MPDLLPDAFKGLINMLARPKPYAAMSILLLLALLRFREAFATKRALGIILGIGGAFFVLSFGDPNFRLIVSKPDNVPISMMLVAVIFFTWLSMRQAVENDRRIARGDGPAEAEESNDLVWAWPDLVYIELICMVLFTVGLLVWSMAIEAPIEEPASSTRSPNPAKAPWYFLGLQEMLVYFDPWLAGVVLPTMIVVGLMALPYIDTNPKGNGYYTFKERSFAISYFLFGFLSLWTALILLGTFLRGPNWNFFGPYEFWDIHKLEALVNVNLSELFWVGFLNQGLPQNILVREGPGILLVLAYLGGVPPILAATILRAKFKEIGLIRFGLLSHLWVMMMTLPIKMLLRWFFNLKYIVAIPEYFFNI